MHEKVVAFIVTMFESGLGVHDCLDCGRPNKEGGYMPMGNLEKDKLKIIVQALQIAGFNIEEIRELAYARPETLNEQMMEGLYEPCGCRQIKEIVRMVKARYPDSDHAEQKSA